MTWISFQPDPATPSPTTERRHRHVRRLVALVVTALAVLGPTAVVVETAAAVPNNHVPGCILPGPR